VAFTTERERRLVLGVLPELLALRPSVYRARVGAVLCDRRGNVLSIGFNQHRTHPKAARWHTKGGRPFCCTVHAEMDVLIRNPGATKTSGVFLGVSRVRRIGPGLGFETCLALPCAGCMVAIGDVGVKRVLFSTSNDTTGELRL